MGQPIACGRRQLLDELHGGALLREHGREAIGGLLLTLLVPEEGRAPRMAVVVLRLPVVALGELGFRDSLLSGGHGVVLAVELRHAVAVELAREAVVVPIWSHEVAATRGPKGEYVAYFSYNADEGPANTAAARASAMCRARCSAVGFVSGQWVGRARRRARRIGSAPGPWQT